MMVAESLFSEDKYAFLHICQDYHFIDSFGVLFLVAKKIVSQSHSDREVIDALHRIGSSPSTAGRLLATEDSRSCRNITSIKIYEVSKQLNGVC